MKLISLRWKLAVDCLINGHFPAISIIERGEAPRIEHQRISGLAVCHVRIFRIAMVHGPVEDIY